MQEKPVTAIDDIGPATAHNRSTGSMAAAKRARELGDYLIVGVTTDNFDYERGKLNVRDSLMERIKAVEASGFADQIVIE